MKLYNAANDLLFSLNNYVSIMCNCTAKTLKTLGQCHVTTKTCHITLSNSFGILRNENPIYYVYIPEILTLKEGRYWV